MDRTRYCFPAFLGGMRNAYHRISALVSAAQAPAEYMSGGGTHITDYDPESGEYGDARYERRRGDAPTKGTVDSWVAMHNSGVRTLDIAKGSGYPFRTVENEIAKHPGGRGTVLMSVHLTEELAERVDTARGGEAASKFILKLLERGVTDSGYAKAAGRRRKPPTADERDRWRRMRGRGLSNSQIAEAVGEGPDRVYDAIGPQDRAERKERPGPQRKLSVRMPLWLKNLLDAAAETAGTTRAKLMRALIGRGLERAVA